MKNIVILTTYEEKVSSDHTKQVLKYCWIIFSYVKHYKILQLSLTFTFFIQQDGSEKDPLLMRISSGLR
jgi:hypothetical protein